MAKYCKLSDYAKKFGVTYRTAFNRFNAGKLEGAIRDNTGHICVPIEYLQGPISSDVTIYASVSGNKPEDLEALEAQAQTLVAFCNSRGYHVDRVVKEVASSITETRPKLNEILKDRNIKHIVVEHKNRLARFGYEYIETLLEQDQREIEAMNSIAEDKEELLNDFVRVIYSVCKTLGTKRVPKKNIRQLVTKLGLNANIDELED